MHHQRSISFKYFEPCLHLVTKSRNDILHQAHLLLGTLGKGEVRHDFAKRRAALPVHLKIAEGSSGKIHKNESGTILTGLIKANLQSPDI
jgi:hypothetical protein